MRVYCTTSVNVVDWLSEPTVADTVIVLLPFGVFGPELPPPQLFVARPSMPKRTSVPKMRAPRLRARASPPRPNTITARMGPAACFHPRLELIVGALTAAATSVATESVVDAAAVPLGVTVAGEKPQEEAVGNPAQAKLTC